MAHWSLYLHWALYVSLGAAILRHLSVSVVRVFGALTKDRQRSVQSLEMVRLSRRDAKHIPSYLSTTNDHEVADAASPPSLQAPPTATSRDEAV